MMRIGTMLGLGGAILTLGLFGQDARGEFLVQVTATLTPTVSSYSSSTPGVHAVLLDGGATTNGQSTTVLAPFSNSPANLDLAGTTSTVHETYGTTSVSSGNTTASDAFDTNYSWTLTFAHVVGGVPTGPTASLVVPGFLFGNLSSTGSTLANAYTGGPISSPVPLTVDGRTVYVQLDPWTPPGTPYSATNDFSVAMANSPSGFFVPAGETNAVPEPATLALLGVGGLIVLAPRLRRAAKRAA